MQLIAIIRKELQSLVGDLHGLLLLFVMPLVFILVMSLAMKDDFDRRAGVSFDVLVIDRDQSHQSRALLETLAASGRFALHTQNDVRANALAHWQQAVRKDQYHFLLTIPPDAFTLDSAVPLSIGVAPSTSEDILHIFLAQLRGGSMEIRAVESLRALQDLEPDIDADALIAEVTLGDEQLFAIGYAYAQGDTDHAADKPSVQPTAVQQSVPAWLVFSVFFVVIPLANTLIRERQQGTLRRLRTIDVPRWKLVAGKLLPYFFINQLQVVLMLLVGIYLVPLLGGDRLVLGNSTAGLALMSTALSVAALGYAMLIAVISRTTEQATILGGAGNIILAAIGGIMVPTFVMPRFMQDLSTLSPMSWGLQGFLDIFLRSGRYNDVLGEALPLFAMGLLALAIALHFWDKCSD